LKINFDIGSEFERLISRESTSPAKTRHMKKIFEPLEFYRNNMEDCDFAYFMEEFCKQWKQEFGDDMSSDVQPEDSPEKCLATFAQAAFNLNRYYLSCARKLHAEWNKK